MLSKKRGIFSLFVSFLSIFMTAAQEIQKFSDVVGVIGKAIEKEVQTVKQPIDETIAYIGSKQCGHVKQLLGVSYEQLQGMREPDLNRLTLVFRYKDNSYLIQYYLNAFTTLDTVTINLNNAEELLERISLDGTEKLVLYAHGFADKPTKEKFQTISDAYLAIGHKFMVALDGSSLLKSLYPRSSSYVHFIGERLGQVLATMVQRGLNPDKIHLVGHSLGAHIVGFAGKTFQLETGLNISRITGLDPAGPCFTHVEPELRLKASDADFVDVIHTDAGVLGIKDTVGHADYFPNSGSMQPSCLLQTCSHSRSVFLYAASVGRANLFPAVKCDNWEDFKRGRCSDEISYMGFGAKPTSDKFHLQTSGEYPYGLEEKGLKYRKKIQL